MSALARLRRSFALSVCPALRRELFRSPQASAVPGVGAWTAPISVDVVNMSKSAVDVSYDQDARLWVIIHPVINAEAVYVADGSCGIEWSPEEARDIQRPVELPAGGPSSPDAANGAKWRECQAARWVASTRTKKSPPDTRLRFKSPSHVSSPSDVKREPTRPRALPPLRAAWKRLCRVSRWADDGWVGDLVGVAGIFGALWIFLIVASAFE
jgi:hypothetical protein